MSPIPSPRQHPPSASKYNRNEYGDGDEFGGWRATVLHVASLRQKLKIVRAEAEASSEDTDDDSSLESLGTSESEEAQVGGSSQLCSGLRAHNPELYTWVRTRLGAPLKLVVALIFVLSDAAKYVLSDLAFKEGNNVNPISVYIVYLVISFTIAVSVSIIMEGSGVIRQKLLNWHSLWRFAGISLLFSLANFIQSLAFQTGLDASVISMLGYFYLPISALLSFVLFSRHYGRLEWLSMAIMVLAMLAYILVRERCKANQCQEFKYSWSQENPAGMCLVLISVSFSVFASLLAERIYKDKDAGLQRAHGGQRNDRFYVMKVHLDFCQLIYMLFLWSAPDAYGQSVARGASIKGITDRWFGDWTWKQCACVAVLILQSWMAGVVVKRFSTVIKAVMQTVSTVFVLLIADEMDNKRYAVDVRFVQSVIIALIVVFAALVFQTGRINLKLVQRALGLEKSSILASGWSLRSALRHKSKDAIEVQEKVPEGPSASSKVMEKICAYSIMVIYVLADAIRSPLLYVVQSTPFIVPQTTVVATAFCGLVLAQVLVLKDHGLAGLKSAWNPRKILKFLLPGLMQAISGSLGSLALALHMSAAEANALGKIYTPEAALLSRFIMGKFYMWLEWFSLVILTLASIDFGLLDSLGSSNKESTFLATACVIGSATTSCLMSLVMERLLKTETEPFIMQKVRLDFGALVFTAMFWPVMGWLGEIGDRPDLAYWEWRSNSYNCEHEFNANTPACSPLGNYTPKIYNATTAACECGKGVFVGWDTNWINYVFLAISVFHGWIIGLLVRQFSSVHRAIADGFTIVPMYFLVEPLFSRLPYQSFKDAYYTGPRGISNWAKDAMALIMPLAGMLYLFARTEMQKVTDLMTDVPTDEPDAKGAEAGDTSEDGEMESGSEEKP